MTCKVFIPITYKEHLEKNDQKAIQQKKGQRGMNRQFIEGKIHIAKKY